MHVRKPHKNKRPKDKLGQLKIICHLGLTNEIWACLGLQRGGR